MRILGIDPGSAAAGFGVVDAQGSALAHVAHGTLRPPKTADGAARLYFMYDGLREVIGRYQPDVACVELVFVSVSPRSALVLGQARGALMAAIGGADIVASEYAATRIKQTVTGNGQATKSQMQKMVQRTLKLEKPPPQDAADALAAAICHGRMGKLGSLGLGGRAGRRGSRREVALAVRRRP